VTGTENSSVFRHAVPRAGYSYVFAECGLELRERPKRAEIGGRNRTYFDAPPLRHQGRATALRVRDRKALMRGGFDSFVSLPKRAECNDLLFCSGPAVVDFPVGLGGLVQRHGFMLGRPE
jgi:hypothetical protein